MTDRELLEQALDALDSECSATINHAQETIRKILEQPKKEWVRLTDDEAIDIEQWSPDIRWAIIRTEAKLKEKNT